MVRYLSFFFIIFGSSYCQIYAQEWIADSLIQELQSAKPGYDQIDYNLGIARGYMIARENEKFKSFLDEAWQLSEEYNDLAGKAQCKVFYHLLERTNGGNLDKATTHAKEAYEYALASGDMDALTFAVYQYAEVLGRYQKKNDVALELIEQHFDKVDETVTLKNKANFYKSYGHALARQGNDQEAIAYYKEALKILESIITNPDLQYRLKRVSALYADKGIVNTSVTKNELAKAYSRIGNLTEAIRLSHENLDLVTTHDIPDYIAWVSSNLGGLYKEKGDYETAIQFFQEATLIWEKDPSAAKDIALMKRPLGEIYNVLGDYEQAQQNFQYAMNYAVEHGDTVGYIEAMSLRGRSFMLQGQLETALKVISEAERLALGFGSEEILAGIKIEKGVINQSLGKYQEALDDLQAASQFFSNTANSSRFPAIYNQMAENHQILENDELAIKKLEESIQLAIKYGQGDELSRAYELLSGIYKAQGDYKLALENFKLFHANENNLLANNAQKILREEQVRQNVNQFKEEKELATERAALLQTQNRLYTSLAASLLGFLLIGSYLYRQVRKSRSIIQKRNKELADLNSTKDKFFGIIAHDIRSPLVALGGVGEQMDYYLEKGKTDKMKNLSKKISKTSDHLSALLDNLLNWALLQRGVLPHKPENISLHNLISECLNMFQLNAETKSITLLNQVDKDVYVNADMAAINTIVRNLVSNALKFTPQGGQITIETEVSDYNVCLKVRDNGIGMSPEKASKIFELNPNRDSGTDGEKGTGLGLMLCKELVELNKGAIRVDTIEDQGSTFSIELPQAA